MMSRALTLYAHTRAGPVRLAAPAGVTDLNQALDAAPLGIYEGMRTFDRVRFIGLDAHLDRAERSLAALGWSQAWDRDGLRRTLHAVVSESPFPETRVRFDVLAAPATDLGTDSRILVAAGPLPEVPAGFLARGVACPLVRDLRRERPRIKRASFVIARRGHPVGARDAYEPIMVDGGGRLLEGVSSNVFAVRGGALRTAGEGVLEGITGQIVRELARAEGIPARAEAVSEDELPALQECFLTSSVRSIVPIVEVAGVRIGSGAPGPITRRLMDVYAGFCAREARPAWPPGA